MVLLQRSWVSLNLDSTIHDFKIVLLAIYSQRASWRLIYMCLYLFVQWWSCNWLIIPRLRIIQARYLLIKQRLSKYDTYNTCNKTTVIYNQNRTILWCFHMENLFKSKSCMLERQRKYVKGKWWKHYTWERSSLVNRSQQKYGGTADKLCDSKLRDEIKIAIFIESITYTGNGIVNHETFTCNSDLLVLYNQAIFL